MKTENADLKKNDLKNEMKKSLGGGGAFTFPPLAFMN